MNKLVMIGGAAFCAAVLTGCGTVNPLDYPMDTVTYTPTAVRPVEKEAYKVVAISSVTPHATDTSKDVFVAKSMEGSVVEAFNGLGSFDTVDRKNGIQLEVESCINGQDSGATGADYALVTDSHVAFVAKQGWKRTAFADKARGVELVTDYRLIDLATKQPIISKTVKSVVADVEKGNVDVAITAASKMNATKFAQVVAARLLPEVRVKQTRGEGRFAQVAMGRNYQAVPAISSWKWWPYKYLPLCYVKSEDMPGTAIDFCYTEKNGEEYDNVVFAHGTVISCTQKDAWVEVKDHEKAGVKKNHSAIISDEDDGSQAALQ